MNHYPRHVGDYLRDTVGLTMLEDGAYTRLLDQYYSRDGPLPVDKAVIYRISRATSKQERSAVNSVLSQFFTLAVDGWHSKRADIELQAQCERSASARESAKHRWNGVNANAHANAHANAMRTHSDGNANGYAESMLTSNQKPKRTKTNTSRAPPATLLSPEFSISDKVETWAKSKGYSCLTGHFENFVAQAKAKGYTYVDWDAAFMNAIRKDWANLNGSAVASHDDWRRAL